MTNTPTWCRWYSLMLHRLNSAISQNHKHIVGTCFHTLFTSSLHHLVWVIGFGASTHISHDKSVFKNLKSAQNMTIILPNKNIITIQELRDIDITEDICLWDVLLIPEFQYNLFSISSLLKDSKYSITFSNNHYILQDTLSSRMIGKAENIEGLYLPYT